MKPDLFWIPGPWRGNLAVVPRPRGGDWLEDEARAWQQAGIGVIVSLLETDEAAGLDLAKEPDAAKSNNIRFISFPIPDRGVPASQENALSFLAAIASILDDGQNVAIHCRQSVGRSGLIAAGLLVRSGMDADSGGGRKHRPWRGNPGNRQTIAVDQTCAFRKPRPGLTGSAPVSPRKIPPNPVG
jgi:protein-tyrosine phosphatase